MLNFSVHKHLHYMPPRFPFRHPTEAAARKEAERLANEPNHIGWRFGVFHYEGISAKVEKPDEALAVEAVLQAA